jgi:signal recognition particle subunit SRP54
VVERLTNTFESLFRRLTGSATITESNVADAMQDVRRSLLEADVHLDVINAFCDRVVKDAIGSEVAQSLRPGEAMVGIVYSRLVELLGGRRPEEAPSASTALEPPPSPIRRAVDGPAVVMVCGLQGSGKTTTVGKIAALLKKRGWSVMLGACDLQRPAAVEQLHTLAEQVAHDMPGDGKVFFHGEPDKCAAYGQAIGVAVDVARRAVEAARNEKVDVVLLDTAGRLHVNDALMDELVRVRDAVRPQHIFLVVDAMTGQDAVISARAFHQRLSLDGVILTKFDSDTRGGAALSVREVTGAPIRYIGVGEKLDALEEFHPERFAGRILGMGDVLSLVEKAREHVSDEEAAALQSRFERGELGMDDFLKQLRTLRRMGPIRNLLGMLPGVGSMLQGVHIDEKQLDRIEAIVNSMTREERRKPSIIDISRRRRIARGSGVQPEEVSALIRQFEMVSRMTREMSRLSGRERLAAVKELGSGTPASRPFPSLSQRKGTYTPSIKSRFKKRK